MYSLDIWKFVIQLTQIALNIIALAWNIVLSIQIQHVAMLDYCYVLILFFSLPYLVPGGEGDICPRPKEILEQEWERRIKKKSKWLTFQLKERGRGADESDRPVIL